MKKWNKPELLTLGVENTFEENCDCSVVGSTDGVNPAHIPGIGHHCHANGILGGTHIGSDKWNPNHTDTSNVCDSKWHNKCCCYKAPSTPQQPQS